ncbi:hypothetical protein ACQR3P_31905 [Rhodococcus sp. IEGM1300]
MDMVLSAVGAKEVTWVDELVSFTDKFDTVATIALAFINVLLVCANVYLVFTVYRYTKKMSQSKISISPESRLSVLSVLEQKQIEQEVEKAERDTNYFVYFYDVQGEGFPIDVFDKPVPSKTMSIRVKNRGDMPSIDIKISLKLKIYKTENTYDDKDPYLLDIVESKRKLHKEHNYDIIVPYMGADEERVYELFEVTSHFREFELLLEKIESNGFEYFKEKTGGSRVNPTVVRHYTHPKLYLLGDSQDMREVYGHKALWEEGVAEKLREEHEDKLFQDIEKWL